MSEPRHSDDVHKGWYSRGYQPHCDYPGLVQSLGFRLFDSVPSEVIERWHRELAFAADRCRQAALQRQIERYADLGCGCCWLADPRLAELTENAILHFDGARYDLLAWCVMANHVHVLAAQRPGHPLGKIVQSWKSFVAHQANCLLGRQGAFWFRDYFDEFMTSTSQLEATIEYIEHNPVAAGAVWRPEDWQFSSAAARHRARVRATRARYREVDWGGLPDF